MQFNIRSLIQYIILLFIVFNFGLSEAKAQCCPLSDSVQVNDSTRVQYFFLSLDSISSRKLQDYPLSTDDFRRYNPVHRHYTFYQSMGNTGQFYQPLTHEIQSNTGFDYGIHNQDIYIFKPENLKYYRNLKPFTEISYVMGGKRENLLNVTHTQNVYKGIVFGVDFNLINSVGFYQRQKTDHSNVAVKLHYFTPNKRYGIAGYFFNNRMINRENGGIQADSIFEQNLESNRAVVQVKLQTAETRFRETSAGFQQYFQLSGPGKIESVVSEVQPVNKLNFILGRISHEFQYSRQSFIYYDSKPDTLYYRNINYDSIQTNDSTGIHYYHNQVGWTNTSLYNDKEPIVRIYGGIRHSLVRIRGREVSSDLSQVTYIGRLGLSLWSNMEIFGNGQFCIGDYNNLDYFLEGGIFQNVIFKSGKKIGIEGRLVSYSRDAGWFFQKYVSNHFVWDNDFVKEQGQSISGILNILGYRSGVEFQLVKNMVVFGQDTLPKQISDNIRIVKLSFSKSFKFHNWYGSANLIYQNVSNTADLRLPDFMADVSLYYARNLFKGALFGQFGFDARYFSSFKAMAYSPPLRSFYNQDDKEIGNYPYIDVFVQARIKRTLLFLKYEHVNALFGNFDYFSSPQYPMPDAAFKLGVRWRFND